MNDDLEYTNYRDVEYVHTRDLQEIANDHFVLAFDNYLKRTFDISERDFVKLIKENFPENII